jgi:ATPase subunit of ABC transporter with duplicated ATPase domains
MKKNSLILIAIFLITIGSSFQQVAAQEKTKAEAEKEAKIQQSIDQQKKALAEQKKAQANMDQNMKKKSAEFETFSDSLNVELENANEERAKIFMTMPRGNRSFNFDEPFSSAAFAGQDMGGWYGHSMGDSERTTWDFSKSVKDNTFSRDYAFDVEKTSKSVVMSVMGDCKSGEIRIKIIMPNGKSYSDILIDESGNLNWRKSFTISESENQDKTGDWKFQISSAKATGFFKISLQTF